MSADRVVDRREVRVPFYWRSLTRREREVMTRYLERHAQQLVAEWDAEDRRVAAGDVPDNTLVRHGGLLWVKRTGKYGPTLFATDDRGRPISRILARWKTVEVIVDAEGAP